MVRWGKQLLNAPVELIVELSTPTDVNAIEQRLQQKFAWLVDYQEQLEQWGTMVFLTRTLETQIKLFGLNQESLEQFETQVAAIIVPSSLQSFLEKITAYLKREISLFPEDLTFPGTSDVLESIFGKYKRFSARSPLKDLRQMLLTIPLSTMTLTTDLVKQALETIRGRDLEQWLHQVFGQSMLSKRKTLFAAGIDDVKSA